MLVKCLLIFLTHHLIKIFKQSQLSSFWKHPCYLIKRPFKIKIFRLNMSITNDDQNYNVLKTTKCFVQAWKMRFQGRNSQPWLFLLYAMIVLICDSFNTFQKWWQSQCFPLQVKESNSYLTSMEHNESWTIKFCYSHTQLCVPKLPM